LQRHSGANHPAPGSLDTTFGKAGVATLTIANSGTAPVAAFEQSNGDLVVVGAVATSTPTLGESALIARFTSAGVLDTTFGTKGITTTSIANLLVSPTGVGVLPNGDILVGAAAGSLSATGESFVLLAYKSNGELDTTFGASGIVNTAVDFTELVGPLLVQPNGQIVMAGFETSSSKGAPTFSVLIRYNSNGSLDTTFGTGGIVRATPSVGEGASTIVLLANGDYLLSGPAGEDEFTSTGTLLSTVTTDTVTAFGTDNSTFFLSSGDFIGASSANPPGTGTTTTSPARHVAPNPAADVVINRFTETGTADPTFTPTTFAFVSSTTTSDNQSNATNLALTSSGQIIAAEGSPILIGLARLDANGGLDSTFGAGGVVTSSAGEAASGLLVQNNGNIVVLSETASTNGTASLVLLRFIGN